MRAEEEVKKIQDELEYIERMDKEKQRIDDIYGANTKIKFS
jgi:hypothetical protein